MLTEKENQAIKRACRAADRRQITKIAMGINPNQFNSFSMQRPLNMLTQLKPQSQGFFGSLGKTMVGGGRIAASPLTALPRTAKNYFQEGGRFLTGKMFGDQNMADEGLRNLTSARMWQDPLKRHYGAGRDQFLSAGEYLGNEMPALFAPGHYLRQFFSNNHYTP
jgi:hypothetical protein